MKRKLGQQPPRGTGYGGQGGGYGGGQGGGYGGGQGGGNGGGKAGGHPSQMTIQDKIASTCKDW